MYNRYRGRWLLSKKKLPFIKQVIVVHDRVVSKVFLNPVFKSFEEDNKLFICYLSRALMCKFTGKYKFTFN